MGSFNISTSTLGDLGHRGARGDKSTSISLPIAKPIHCQFTYVLTEGGPQELTNLHGLMQNYSYVFDHEDRTCLTIVAADSCAPETLSLAKAFQSSIIKTRLHPKIEVIPITLNAANCEKLLRQSDVPLSGTAPNWQELFRLYERTLKSPLNLFESEDVVNVYDPDYITCRRKNEPHYSGSTFLSALPHLMHWLQSTSERVGSILEIGCGAGAFYAALRNLYAQLELPLPFYTGLDRSRHQILRAHDTFPEANFRVGTAAELPYQDATFDLVVTNSVIDFIPEPWQSKAIHEMLRVSKGQIYAAFSASDRCDPRSPQSVPRAYQHDKNALTHFADLALVIRELNRYPELHLDRSVAFGLFNPQSMDLIEINLSTYEEMSAWNTAPAADAIGGQIISVPNQPHINLRLFRYENIIIMPKTWLTSDQAREYS